MGKKDWSMFRIALAGGLVGAMLMAMLPAIAATGDNMIIGRRNGAGSPTKLVSGNAITTMRITNGGMAPALDLRTNPGVPPMAVDRAAWVQNLNADLLDGRQANELVRAAFASSANLNEATIFGTGTAADLLTLQITAPHKGILLISGGVDTGVGSGGYDEFTCLLEVDNVTVTGTRRVTIDSELSGNDNGEEDCSPTGGRVVNAGNHRVDLRMTGWDGVEVFDASLTALFVPFTGTGGTP